MIRETDETLARLTFNAAAASEFFHPDGKGMRLQIEGREVMFRSVATTRGADVLVLTRRAGRITAEIPVDQLTQRMMQRLFRAGLTESEPFFLLEAATRGWFGIQHHPGMESPPRQQPIMTVTAFEMPPPPTDLAVWRRFQRALSQGRPIGTDQWQEVRAMVLGAVQIVARGGRSNRYILANSLLALVERNMRHLLTWRQRQPALAAEVNELIERVTGEPPPLQITQRARPVAEPETDPEADPDTTVPMAKPARRRQSKQKRGWWMPPVPVTEPFELTDQPPETKDEDAGNGEADVSFTDDKADAEPDDAADGEVDAPFTDKADAEPDGGDAEPDDAVMDETVADHHDDDQHEAHIDPYREDDQPPDNRPEVGDDGGYDKK